MFCLRSWIPVLFFLTNASPIYLLLFISATYFLNRPCIYCSLLLFILVISLFDFSSSWFEPRHLFESSSPTTSSTNTTATPSTCPSNPSSLPLNNTAETVGMVASAVNSSVQALASAAVEEVKRRVMRQEAPQPSASELGWFKSLLGQKKEWRVPCVDVLVRL